MFKVGDRVQVRKDWRINMILKYRESLFQGTIIEFVTPTCFYVNWDKVGIVGGSWTRDSVELIPLKHHPYTNIFK